MALMPILLILRSQLIPQDDVAAILYREGLKKYILEDYRGAIEDFDSAYRIDPENIRIRKMYINTLIKQGNIEYEKSDLEAAKDYFLRAFNLSGEDEELKETLQMIQSRIDEEKSQIAQKQAKEEGLEEKHDQAQEAAQEKKDEGQKQEQEVKLPFDMDTFIQQQNEENRKLLSKMLEAQRAERETLLRSIEENQRLLEQNIKTHSEERETFLRNLIEITRSQSEDRKLFSRTLMILVGGSISIALILFFSFIIVLKRRARAASLTSYSTPHAEVEFETRTLLEYPKNIEEAKYIHDENYSEIVRAKRLSELYHKLQNGNVTWNVIQGYISELDHELKSEILDIVEKKLKSGETSSYESAFEILLPFITDGDVDIGSRSKKILKTIGTSEVEGAEPLLHGYEETEGSDDPLGFNSLVQLAKMADTKTGRINHSVHVSEISFKIAQVLKNPELDPGVVRRVALVHDIGYLELDDKILKKDGGLTERQFSIIKTHAVRGLNLFQHIQLPESFIEGIKHHHERLDGSGYPDGLKGEAIPLIARVLAVADFFDAITSSRPYRPALTIGSGIKMMEKLAGDIFDRNIFEILKKLYKDQMESTA